MSVPVDPGRRALLRAATTATGAVGLGLASLPFIASWRPSERAKTMAAPVEIEISKLEPGAMIKVVWRGKPVFVVRRTPEALAGLTAHDADLIDPGSALSVQPDYAQNPARSIRPEFLVVLGVCTHLGCTPLGRFVPGDPELGDDWPGGFYCPCHGARFDLAGRVFRNGAAPSNLSVPPYKHLDDHRILVGEEPA